ncbi:hypothetical protein Zmor_016092 [Zophobas morio]|uniref:PHD-type domain-containing protein n=1 Tax=Zophobas morio TaxID=2755281 RepID=A0AA38II38_9CUCU|nr:hypothetical protein Zmor_016092 [Zophobas morio]
MADDEDGSNTDPQKYNNCKLCKSYIGINTARIKCKKCSVVLHIKCFENLAKLVCIREDEWYCKSCESALDDVHKSAATLEYEKRALQEQVLLLQKLVDQLERVNHLQTEKIESIELNSFNKQQVAKTPPIFLIRSTKIKPDKVLETICDKVKSQELNVKINSTKVLNTGLLVKFDSDCSRDILMNELKTSPSQEYVIEKSKKWNSRLFVKGGGKIIY